MTKVECPIRNIRSLPAVAGNPWFLCGRAILVIARIRSVETAADSADLTTTCAVLGNARSELRIGSIYVRSSFLRPAAPHSPMNRARIKRAFSIALAGCKENLHQGEPLIFKSKFP
jgi:hypothetical protein